uniref:Family with sequence similarity 217, member A n=1 Tax=Mus spicilegus TaxID=10103 RepID=A0A8C6GBJ5_MUSSI
MSRVTQRAPVSPEHLPLSAGHSCAFDKASWLPEGRVFSNVQREKIISKFLKRSVLKRVFGSQQLRWEGPNSQREDSSSTGPSTTTKAGVQPEPTELFAQQEEEPVPWAGDQEDDDKDDNNNDEDNNDDGQDTWDFEADEITLSGTWMQKNSLMKKKPSHLKMMGQQVSHLENPAEQLILQLTVSEHAHSRSQNSNQGVFQLWSSPVNKGSTVDKRNSSVEENVTDESDLSENEKMNDSLLSYFKKMDLNLKPETIEHVERPFPEEAGQVPVYADFLPAPFNTLDLHRFAFSKCESWKAAVEPPESSIERLILRLLELERLQHMTIQRERPRLQSTFYSSMFSMAERPSSSKAIATKAKAPKIPETSTLQTSGVDKNRDKRKNNSGSGKPEQNVSKWSLSSAGKSKSNSRALLKCSSTSKQCAVAHDDLKNSKNSSLNPCQEPPLKPTTTTQATQPMARVVSTRCLPPRSPMPVPPIPLSFPENPREEGKVPRTKKKCHRKSILLNRAFYIQKRNCLSPSLIARGKCSPTDQK